MSSRNSHVEVTAKPPLSTQVFIERQADTSRGASYATMALCAAAFLYKTRKAAAAAAAAAKIKGRDDAILRQRDREYLDSKLAPPEAAPREPRSEAATPRPAKLSTPSQVTPSDPGDKNSKRRAEVPPPE